MRRRVFISLAIMFVFSISLVVALECDTVPGCADLGFNMSVSDCAGQEIMRCPKDPTNDNAVYCGGMCQDRLVFHNLWNGRADTFAIVSECGDGTGIGSGSGSGSSGETYAAKVALDYYAVSSNHAHFGKGKWYLPALGELVDMYGFNYANMQKNNCRAGATGENKAKINSTLQELYSKGLAAEKLNGSYRGSTESSAVTEYASQIDMEGGCYSVSHKNENQHYKVRPFLLLENKIDGNISIGDIVYADLSHTTKENYVSGKTPVGVVAWVSDDKHSVKILALVDAPGTPRWGDWTIDITGVANFDFNVENIFGDVSSGSISKYTLVNGCSTSSGSNNSSGNVAGDDPRYTCDHYGALCDLACQNYGGVYCSCEKLGTCASQSPSGSGSGSGY